MKPTCFALALVCLTSHTIAWSSEVTGSWTGASGEVQLIIDGQDQGTAPCSTFEFNWIQEVSELKLVKGYWHCGYQLVFEQNDRSFEIRPAERIGAPDELWIWGERVGTLRPGEVILSEENGAKGAFLEFRVLGPNQAEINYTWTDGFSKIIVRGSLTK